MNIKKYLNKSRKLNEMIDIHLKELAAIRYISTSIAGIDYSERVQSSISNDKMTDSIAKIVEYECMINTEIDKLYDLKNEIYKNIMRLNNVDDRQVLLLRYVNCGEFWADIANKMHYAPSTVYRIHGRALQHLNDMINVESQ